MSALARVPRNATVLREYGAYRAGIDFGGTTTEGQRKSRSGLHTFEPGTQATLLTLVQLADSHPTHFFDVGAHIGMHSLIMSAVYPVDRVEVTAFEPTPRTAAICRTLAATNNFQMRIELCAVSDTDGTAQLFISPWETSNSMVAGFREAQDVFEVRTRSLDSYCTERGVQPDVIKIDVETYESQVMNGAAELLRTARPSIVCEILAAAEPSATVRTLEPLLAAGYHLHRWTVADGWLECSAKDVMDKIPHDGNDWLFTPAPLTGGFRRALAEWRTAIAECATNSTVRVERPPADGRPPSHELSEAPGAWPARLLSRR